MNNNISAFSLSSAWDKNKVYSQILSLYSLLLFRYQIPNFDPKPIFLENWANYIYTILILLLSFSMIFNRLQISLGFTVF